MKREEKWALALVAFAVAAMIWYDRTSVKSGIKPLLAQEEEFLADLGNSVVGMSEGMSNPAGVAYINQAVPWGWPLPSMLPTAAGGGGNTGQPI